MTPAGAGASRTSEPPCESGGVLEAGRMLRVGLGRPVEDDEGGDHGLGHALGRRRRAASVVHARWTARSTPLFCGALTCGPGALIPAQLSVCFFLTLRPRLSNP